MWWHIEFVDGRNPYICKDMRDFQRMNERYELELIKEGFYKATFENRYIVVAFKDKTRPAVMNRVYKTKSGAERAITKYLIYGGFEVVMIRKETFYLNNNEELEISTSAPLVKWTKTKNGYHKEDLIKKGE